jgi:hypothetical protein
MALVGLDFIEAEGVEDEQPSGGEGIASNFTANQLNPRARAVGGLGQAPREQAIRSAFLYDRQSDAEFQQQAFEKALRKEMGISRKKAEYALNPTMDSKFSPVGRLSRTLGIDGERLFNQLYGPKEVAGTPATPEQVASLSSKSLEMFGDRFGSDKPLGPPRNAPGIVTEQAIPEAFRTLGHNIQLPGQNAPLTQDDLDLRPDDRRDFKQRKASASLLMMPSELSLYRALVAMGPEMIGQLNLKDEHVIEGLTRYGRRGDVNEKLDSKIAKWQAGKHTKREMNDFFQKKGGKGKSTTLGDYVGKGLSYVLPAAVSMIFGGALGPALGALYGAAGAAGTGIGGTSIAATSAGMTAGTGIGGAVAQGIGSSVMPLAIQAGRTGRFPTLQEAGMTLGTAIGTAGAGNLVGGADVGYQGPDAGGIAGSAQGGASGIAGFAQNTYRAGREFLGSPLGSMAKVGAEGIASAVMEEGPQRMHGGASGQAFRAARAPAPSLRDSGVFDEDDLMSGQTGAIS